MRLPTKLTGRRLPRWKALPIPPRVRWAVLLGLIVLTGVVAYLVAYQAGPTPATKTTREVPAWSWNHKAGWDYTVFLKPNTLFDGARELGAGLTYFDALTEGIQARFSYVFSSDQPARIEGTYEVTADVAETKALWKKSFPVIPETPFLVEEGDAYTVELDIPMDRDFYRDRLAEINRETGLEANADLIYTAHVTVAATTTHGEVSGLANPTLTIPLGLTGSFSLGGEGQIVRSDLIQRSEEVTIPGRRGRRPLFLAIAGALGLVAVLFAQATTDRVLAEHPVDREARRIRRKYRKRIVYADAGEPGLPGQEATPLASIEDLVQVSNDLLKPIVYYRHSSPGNSYLFYIVDGSNPLPVPSGRRQGPGDGQWRVGSEDCPRPGHPAERC